MKQSEIMTLNDLDSEIIKSWGFNPYKIDFQGSSLNRYSTELKFECLNCNHRFKSTFSNLKNKWHETTTYCEKCNGQDNPVLIYRPDYRICEPDKENAKFLNAEYNIMMEIESRLGFQPYDFISLDSGNSVTLRHKCCSAIFTATASQIFDQVEFEDIYDDNKKIKVPFCPKCNHIMRDYNMNYAGTRFIERLHNYFENFEFELPYVFKESNIFRFKDYDSKIIVTCKYCNKDFVQIPSTLFTNDGKSLCPYCGGIPASIDNSIKTVRDLEQKNVNTVTEIEEDEEPELIAVEADVEKMSDEYESTGFTFADAMKISAEKAAKNGDMESANKLNELLSKQYSKDYDPVKIEQESPEFLNPEIADTEEAKELSKEIEPKEETLEELQESMSEIILDYKAETNIDDKEEMLENDVEEYVDDSDDENLGIPDEEPEYEEIIDDSENQKENQINIIKSEDKDILDKDTLKSESDSPKDFCSSQQTNPNPSLEPPVKNDGKKYKYTDEEMRRFLEIDDD